MVEPSIVGMHDRQRTRTLAAAVSPSCARFIACKTVVIEKEAYRDVCRRLALALNDNDALYEKETPGQFLPRRARRTKAREHFCDKHERNQAEGTTRYRDEAMRAKSCSEARGRGRSVERAWMNRPSAQHMKGESTPSDAPKLAY